MSDLTGSAKPVGSVEELRDLGLAFNEYGCCAKQGEKAPDQTDENGKVTGGYMKACPWHDVCRFHDIKRREGHDGKNTNPRIAPENVIFDIILPTGASSTWIGPCFDFYWGGLAKRYEFQGQGPGRNGERIHFLGYADDYIKAGKKVLVKGSRKRHETPVKGCEGCVRGNCTLRKPFEEPRLPERFKRPAETMPFAKNTSDRIDRMRADLTTGHMMESVGLPAT